MVGLGLAGVHVIALGAYLTHAFVEHALKIYVMILGGNGWKGLYVPWQGRYNKFLSICSLTSKFADM